MMKNHTDIDQLLAETADMDDEKPLLTPRMIEIDRLLEYTQDW